MKGSYFYTLLENHVAVKGFFIISFPWNFIAFLSTSTSLCRISQWVILRLQTKPSTGESLYPLIGQLRISGLIFQAIGANVHEWGIIGVLTADTPKFWRQCQVSAKSHPLKSETFLCIKAASQHVVHITTILALRVQNYIMYDWNDQIMT